MIFFKIISYFVKCAQGKFGSHRTLWSGEVRCDFEVFFLNTYYLPPLSNFFGEQQRALYNILVLKALAYFSSTLYDTKKFVHDV